MHTSFDFAAVCIAVCASIIAVATTLLALIPVLVQLLQSADVDYLDGEQSRLLLRLAFYGLAGSAQLAAVAGLVFLATLTSHTERTPIVLIGSVMTGLVIAAVVPITLLLVRVASQALR